MAHADLIGDKSHVGGYCSIQQLWKVKAKMIECSSVAVLGDLGMTFDIACRQLIHQ